MYEFGEELIIESNKVSWLIWIQLLIIILLVILLFYGFSIFSLDESYQSTASASTSSPSSQLNNSRLNNNINSNASLRNTTVEEIQIIKGNAGASTSREITTEQIQETEVSSTKDSIRLSPFQLSEHPCHYIGLAKEAFLKCLGLDSSETASDKRQHLKED